MADESSKPPWIKPKIVAAPKIRQVYWCEFWGDSRLPEMWKIRPVVVISYKNTLHGPCLVIPFSTEPQSFNIWAVELEVEKMKCWAVCNHPSTVSPSRFSQFKGKIPLLSEADFNQVLEKLKNWLPRSFPVEN